MQKKILLLFLLTLFTTQCAIASNMIPNGSFEEGKIGASSILPGWIRRTAGNSFNFHSVDSKIASDGKRSVKVAIPEDAPQKSSGYIASNFIKVEKGKCYKLLFKVLSPKGKASATIVLYDLQKRYAGFGGVKKTTIKNNSNWQTIEVDYYTPNRDKNGYYSFSKA